MRQNNLNLSSNNDHMCHYHYCSSLDNKPVSTYFYKIFCVVYGSLFSIIRTFTIGVQNIKCLMNGVASPSSLRRSSSSKAIRNFQVNAVTMGRVATD